MKSVVAPSIWWWLVCQQWTAVVLVPPVHGLASSSSSPRDVAEETSPNLARWKDRWDTESIGWHKTHVNEALLKHGDKLFNVPSKDESDEPSGSCPGDDHQPTPYNEVRIFVPLCGKSQDMAYLARHPRVTHVVGIDGIQKSLQAFADENPDLQVGPPTANEKFDVMTGRNITLLKGDFFDLAQPTDAWGKFAAIYDRAALVAIQPALREQYLDIMQHRILAPGGRILLVTVEHDSGSGPPFSILEQDVHSLYQSSTTRPDWIDSITVLNPDETERDSNDRISRWYLIQSK